MKRGEHGANLAEFAIIVPLLLIVLLSAVDFGRVFKSYIVITNAARVGARMAARLPCYNDTAKTDYSDQRNQYKNAIMSAVNNEITDPDVALTDVRIDPDPVEEGCAPKGTAIRVTVTADADLLLGSFIGQTDFSLGNYAEMLAVGNDQF